MIPIVSQATIEFLALRIRHWQQIGRSGDAVPDILDELDSLRDAQLDDFLDVWRAHGRKSTTVLAVKQHRGSARITPALTRAPDGAALAVLCKRRDDGVRRVHAQVSQRTRYDVLVSHTHNTRVNVPAHSTSPHSPTPT